MWCSTKPGIYGQGVLDDCELIGRLGEVAVASLLNTTIDAEYKERGDDTDLTVTLDGRQVKIDVKTAERDKGYGIVCSSRNGHLMPLKSQLYVFCHLTEHNAEEQTATVEVVGWLHLGEFQKRYDWNRQVKREDHTGRVVESWRNYFIPHSEMHSLKPIITKTNAI
jgi:hypothetical protein